MTTPHRPPIQAQHHFNGSTGPQYEKVVAAAEAQQQPADGTAGHCSPSAGAAAVAAAAAAGGLGGPSGAGGAVASGRDAPPASWRRDSHFMIAHFKVGSLHGLEGSSSR